jgi:hypothetical protein
MKIPVNGGKQHTGKDLAQTLGKMKEPNPEE